LIFPIQVFNADIENLLTMKDMWKSRKAPTPLNFDDIISLRSNFNSRPSGECGNSNSNSCPGHQHHILRDQQRLSLPENLELFISRFVLFSHSHGHAFFCLFDNSTNRLASRLQNGEHTIAFDKDDDDTLDFVTASSNLRSVVYAIEEKTRWEVKGMYILIYMSSSLEYEPPTEMAGNIIPAIATTNAIISGLIVLQALHLLRKSYESLRNVHLQLKPSVPLCSVRTSRPNPDCGICRDTYVILRCDPSRMTLGQVVEGLLFSDGEKEENQREISVYEEKRVLSDPDWHDNYERTLESLNVTRGKFLTIVEEDDDDEGERGGTISVNLCCLS